MRGNVCADDVHAAYDAAQCGEDGEVGDAFWLQD